MIDIITLRGTILRTTEYKSGFAGPGEKVPVMRFKPVRRDGVSKIVTVPWSAIECVIESEDWSE